MESVKDLSGYCAGCGERLEKENKKVVGVFKPRDLSKKEGIYLLCMPCFDIIQHDKEGKEARLNRVEERFKLHTSIGGRA